MLRIPKQCIDGIALPAAVLVVDAIALIMTTQQSSVHKFGSSPAEIAFAGSSNARAHFLGDRPLCILRIARERSSSDEVSMDPRRQVHVTRAPVGRRRKRVAKPVTPRNKLVVPLDPGNGAPVGASNVRN